MSLTDRAAANRPAGRKRGSGAGRDDLRIFLVAGEHSGDALGGKLMSALSARCKGRIHYLGVGGEDMEAAGLASQFPLSDVAVMGFDDSPVATSVTPGLTTVRQPSREQGEHMASVLLDILAGREPERVTILGTELIIRDSV